MDQKEINIFLAQAILELEGNPNSQISSPLKEEVKAIAEDTI